MMLNISLKGIEELLPETEAKINEKIGKVKKYFNNIQDAKVLIVRQRGQFIMEITLYAAGKILRAEGRGTLIDKALADASEKLERQVRRYKERLTNTKKGKPMPEMPSTLKEQPRIVKTKSFVMKPMSLNEAMLQLELLGHEFFVFKEADTEQLKVIYKRRDGNYGLIESKE
ncbi:MAG: ribosome-associated translation inhibitor RaiA [Caldisericaceae bacterium]|nr:ribosome-associated translation inhibitor RaiA [Caldisericaceae bacterium]